ncbi:MAG: GH92 family glycosyl hydrolase [Bacteroidales bacterium]|nr:GH92 family glycosyl hydrolase [Bacteroidales bacterium]
MKSSRIIFVLFSSILLVSCVRNVVYTDPCAEKQSKRAFNTLTDYVDPFIGTGGHGHTYPGAVLPFGMVQLSPDTRLDGWDGCSAYHGSDSIIYGFSHTHLSGTGCSDYGDILFMPTVGDIMLDNGSKSGADKGYSSAFDKQTEKARPGHYVVQLTEGPVNVDLTATTRTGFHKYQFLGNQQPNIILDLTHRDDVIASSIEIISDTEVAGYRRSRAWASDQHVYFVARFSQPVKSYGIATDDVPSEDIKKSDGKNLKAWFRFDPENGREILMKVGISAVSIEGARKNLDTENPGWEFDTIVKKADQAWEKELSKIIVEGGTKSQRVIFYTSLYHCMLAPNVYMDVDGKYRGRDLEVHQSDKFTNYTVFSLWDTYRASHPLFTLIDHKRTNDFINTFLAQYQQGGKLPVWELGANETGCMIGYHSIPVIADAYIKGINSWDANLALEAMQHSAMQDNLGLKHYREKGYIPSDKEGESVSKTLEYAYDDWCIAEMARLASNPAVYTEYIKRAQNYKNLFDPSSGFFRAKANETWFSPFDPREVNFNYTEANAWQYNFYVPHDVNTFIEMHGGDKAFVKKLDELFSTESTTTGREQADITGLIGQYAHGNEPSHHMAYLYSFAGEAWKTQQMSRRIMDEMYITCTDGLSGNEDCGQMSAWYVMSAMGIYPVCPGSDMYVLGSPLFDKVTMNLENNNKFVISANNNTPDHPYTKSLKLNGEDYKRSWISHFVIMAGGELNFEMDLKPNKSFGKDENDRPFSRIMEGVVLSVPFVKAGERTFQDKTSIELGHWDKQAAIHYSIDGSTPDLNAPLYSKPISTDSSLTIKAIAFDKSGKQSQAIEAVFFQIPKNWSVKVKNQYASQYSAGGDLALINFVKGGEDFKTGHWQGYEGVDLDAVVDLGEISSIHSLSCGFFQQQGAWIFMPEWVEFSFSDDNKTYHSLQKLLNPVDPKTEEVVLHNFELKDLEIKARYIRILAKNQGICPPWHLGAGGKSWIFADEISIH